MRKGKGSAWDELFPRYPVLSDLTRVKSDRACLPFGRRVPRPPSQARSDLTSRIPGLTPLALRLAPSGNGPGHAPLERGLIGPGTPAKKRSSASDC